MTVIIELYGLTQLSTIGFNKPHPQQVHTIEHISDHSYGMDLVADIVTDGLMAEPKNWKTPFFSRYSKFLLMSDWKWSKNALVFSVLKNLNKYGR